LPAPSLHPHIFSAPCNRYSKGLVITKLQHTFFKKKLPWPQSHSKTFIETRRMKDCSWVPTIERLDGTRSLHCEVLLVLHLQDV
jgi:hypothetical protein